MQSPFDELGPPPVAVEAARALERELSYGLLGLEATQALWLAGGGKMFGVLVAQDAAGAEVTLRAFSGMLGERWHWPGFVGPVFDEAARGPVEARGLETLRALADRLEALERSPRQAEARAALAACDDAQRRALATLDEELARRQAGRAAQRAAGCDAAHLEALAQESRADKRRRRWLVDELAQARAPLVEAVAGVEARRRWLTRLRAVASASLMRRLHDTYVIGAFDGQRRPLRALFAPGEPPSGAGDCAAPKLLAEAQRRGLRPVALAEFWFGAPAPTQARRSGELSPACTPKCGPLLPFMLQGVDVAPPRRFAPARTVADDLRVLFEDAWLAVVDKPEGLLSVPGKGAAASVLSWARARWPQATGPLVVHRLDLDTSGLLVLAKDEATHHALQRQFLQRSVDKRYVAVLAGALRGAGGEVSLPLRVDPDSRPRQVVDPVHGKSAVTQWRVLGGEAGTTRVELRPLTGRTHQLRVHAAHALGLGAAIVGDRLYGDGGPRLLLHAARLEFDHPALGRRLVFESPAPF